MKVLVTGSEGFIGKNLIVHLNEIKDVEIIRFDSKDTFNVIEDSIKDIDIIFHLAGVNRPEFIEDFYTGNSDLTKQIIDLLNKYNKNIPFVYTSSIQAELDNDYGKSKKQAEDYILENYSNPFVYRLHNVFGKWSRPNYNSVVATFCHNIANDLPIKINDPNVILELIYIDDICYDFLKVLNGTKKEHQNYYYIEPVKEISLLELSELLYSFKESMESIYVPKTGDEFVKKLYSTYISYTPVEKTVIDALTHKDDRGSFTELVRTFDSGQFSVSFSKPGIVRGNHYHNTKLERFIVIKGTAKISFENINDKTDKYDFVVTEDKIQIVTIPVGYSHKIENIGDDEMILMLWCNELFDENKPDTYFKEI